MFIAQVVLLPHLAQWRQPIEARLGREIGAPVHIGSIEVLSAG